MKTNEILTANILDILFEGKNKEYGAYELRNTYDKRILTALGITAIIIMLLAVIVPGKSRNAYNHSTVFDFETSKLPVEKVQNNVAVQNQVKEKSTKTNVRNPPIIVKNVLVTQKPEEVESPTDTETGMNNNNEDAHKGIITPLEIKSQVIEIPAKNESIEDITHIDVQIPATFKGDWTGYVKKEIEKNIDELTEARESGTCIVKFVVSKDGSVSDVEAITMKGTKLAEIAVNAIRNGPKWIPAQQNGTIVKAYRQQPITFKIDY